MNCPVEGKRLVRARHMIRAVMLACAVFGANVMRGQGLNNDYPIDTTQLKDAGELLGLNMFRFPIDPPPKQCFVDFIIDIYKDTTLEQSLDFIKDSEKNMPTGPIGFSLPKTDTIRQWFYVYFHDESPAAWHLRIRWMNMNQDLEITTDSAITGRSDYRAFDYVQPKPGEKVPLVVRYTAKPGAWGGHCPETSR